jgi:hypothetical protein
MALQAMKYSFLNLTVLSVTSGTQTRHLNAGDQPFWEGSEGRNPVIFQNGLAGFPRIPTSRDGNDVLSFALPVSPETSADGSWKFTFLCYDSCFL